MANKKSYSHTITGKGILAVAVPHQSVTSVTYRGVKMKKVRGTKGVYISKIK